MLRARMTPQAIDRWLQGWRAYGLLAALALLMFLPGLIAIPPFDRDESRFMQATRQMIETGDVVEIRFQEEARNKKPVGIYWAQAIMVSLFSDASSTARWPYRLPSVLGAVLAVLFTFRAGLALFDRRTAFIGAGLLATALVLVAEAHLAKTDAMLAATSAATFAAVAVLWRARHDGAGAGRGWAILFWAAMGWGVLVKGPITPLVAGLGIAALAFFDKDRAWLRDLRWKMGVPIMLAIALPWLIAIWVATDGRFFIDAITGDLLPKVQGGQERPATPPGLFIAISSIIAWPASWFLVPATLFAWTRRRTPEVRFALCWLIPGWLVFELAPTKLPHYVLPVFPPLMLLIAATLTRGGDMLAARFMGVVYGAWSAGVIAFAVALVAMPVWLGIGVLPMMVLAAAILIAGIVLFWRARARGDWPRAGLAVVVSGALAIMLVFAFLLPRLDPLWIAARVQASLAAHAVIPGPLASAGFHEPSLVFMLGTRTRLTSPDGAARHLIERRGPALVEAREDAAFQAALRAAGVNAIALDRIDGINYSNGRRQALTLYSRQP